MVSGKGLKYRNGSLDLSFLVFLHITKENKNFEQSTHGERVWFPWDRLRLL